MGGNISDVSIPDPNGPSEISGEVEDYPEEILKGQSLVEKTAEERREEMREKRFQEFSERNGVFVEINEKLHRVLPGKSIAQILHEIEEIEFFSPELQKCCSCHVFIREDMGRDYDYEFEGLRYKFVRSCVTTVRKNMVIITHQYSRMREKMRQFFEEHIINVLTLLNTSHPNCCHCLYEPRKCEIQHIIDAFKERKLVGRVAKKESRKRPLVIDLEEIIDKDDDEEEEGSDNWCPFEFDLENCIGCMRCVMECEKHQGLISRLKTTQPESPSQNLIFRKIKFDEEEEEEGEDEDIRTEEVITISEPDEKKTTVDKESLNSIDEENQNDDEVVDLEDFFFKKVLNSDACIRCGQCTLVCPNAAIRETQSYPTVLSLLKGQDLTKSATLEEEEVDDKIRVESIEKEIEEEEEKEIISKKKKKKKVVLMISPSSRAMFYQYFAGVFEKKKIKSTHQFDRKETILVSFLKHSIVGFDRVVDLSLGGDIALIETVHEFIGRVEDGGPFPFITSNCPSVVRIVKRYFPELLPNLSTVKTPAQILGGLVKNFYNYSSSKKKKIIEDEEDEEIITVAMVPCTSVLNKKRRRNDGDDIDYYLTTRELIQMAVKFDFPGLFEEELSKINKVVPFDNPLLEPQERRRRKSPDTSRSGSIYDLCGGILESVLQYVNVKDSVITHQLIRHSNVPNLDYRVNDPNVTFRAIVCHGGVKLMRLFDLHRSMKTEITIIDDDDDDDDDKKKKPSKGLLKPIFIEANACSGGCFGGGGGIKFQSKNIVLERWRFVEEMCSRKPSVPDNSEFIRFVYTRIGGKPLSKKSKKCFHKTHKN